MTMLRDWLLASAIFAPCLAEAVPAAAETRVSFSAGLDYSSGDYGGAVDTELVSAPLSARIAHDDWSFRASIQYLSITGPADVSDDGAEGVASRTGTEAGFGDTTLAVTRSFKDIAGSDFFFDATARVRLPTGDEERGLGVGATDYTALGQFGVSQRAGSAYVTLGRRFLGERTGSRRQDGWQAAVGGSLRTGERTRVGASYTWRDASIAGGEDPSEVSGYVSYRLSEDLRVTADVGAGLSDASADYRAGLRFLWRSDLFGDHERR